MPSLRQLRIPFSPGTVAFSSAARDHSICRWRGGERRVATTLRFFAIGLLVFALQILLTQERSKKSARRVTGCFPQRHRRCAAGASFVTEALSAARHDDRGLSSLVVALLPIPFQFQRLLTDRWKDTCRVLTILPIPVKPISRMPAAAQRFAVSALATQ